MDKKRRFDRGYVRRAVDAELDDLFAELPAILLDGPKGVGKTATARQRSVVVRQLDRPDEADVLRADPWAIRNDETPLLIDEWHRVPATFDAVRRIVDERPTGAQFLLTGSAPRESTHSGAGRIVTVRMRPLALFERLEVSTTVSLRALLTGTATIEGRCPLVLADYATEVTSSGFPAFRHLSPRARRQQLDGYIDRIITHDLPEAGFTVRRPATVLAWLRAYAAATATSTSWEKIRNAATPGTDDKPAKTTTLPYIELLTALRILDPIEAWLPTENRLSALTASPKHHLTDPALAARLAHLDTEQLLHGDGPGAHIPRNSSYLGALFESLAALSIRTLAQQLEARVSHLRTQGGRHEVDFIVEGANGIVALEAKLSGAVDDDDVKHLIWLRNALGHRCIDTAVIHTGPEAYRRPDGVAVIPLALLGP